jgi:hypothetical protein
VSKPGLRSVMGVTVPTPAHSWFCAATAGEPVFGD